MKYGMLSLVLFVGLMAMTCIAYAETPAWGIILSDGSRCEVPEGCNVVDWTGEVPTNTVVSGDISVLNTDIVPDSIENTGQVLFTGPTNTVAISSPWGAHISPGGQARADQIAVDMLTVGCADKDGDGAGDGCARVKVIPADDPGSTYWVEPPEPTGLLDYVEKALRE